MPTVSFTANLRRHVSVPDLRVSGAGTLAQTLDKVFEQNPSVRTYVVDDQGRLRRHMNVFIAGAMVKDRTGLSDAVAEDDPIHIMQALSGG